jgi:hypothetical protein
VQLAGFECPSGRSLPRDRLNADFHILLLLQVAEDGKQSLSLGIAVSTQHAHQTLWRGVDRLPEVAKAQRAVDEIPEQRFAGRQISRVEEANSFVETGHAKRPVIPEFLAKGLAKGSRKGHQSALQQLSSTIILPPVPGHADVSSLPPLDPAAQKNDEFITVPAKVDAIPGTRLHADLQYAAAHALVISRVPRRKAQQHSRPRHCIESPEPGSEWTKAINGQVFANVDQAIGTTRVTIAQGRNIAMAGLVSSPGETAQFNRKRR